MDFVMDFGKLERLGCRHRLLGKEPKSLSLGPYKVKLSRVVEYRRVVHQDLIFLATDPAERQQATDSWWQRVGESCPFVAALEILAGHRRAPCRGSLHFILRPRVIFRKSRRFLSAGSTALSSADPLSPIPLGGRCILWDGLSGLRSARLYRLNPHCCFRALESAVFQLCSCQRPWQIS